MEKRKAGTRSRRRDKPPRAPEQPPNRWNRLGSGQQAALLLLGMGAVVGLHYALWSWGIPAVGAVVGRIPVLSTVVGWAYAGGAFIAVGVLTINEGTARAATHRRLEITAGVWSALAVLCLPFGWANEVLLPTDYWAGVFAGAYGLLLMPPVAGVVALVWWLVANKLLRREGDPSKAAVGWMVVAYGALLLVWGSTLLRL